MVKRAAVFRALSRSLNREACSIPRSSGRGDVTRTRYVAFITVAPNVSKVCWCWMLRCGPDCCHPPGARGHVVSGMGIAADGDGLYLRTPAADLVALREPTAGVDLMDRHQLNRFEPESQRTLKKGISHFLSPQLQVLIKEKPRIALSEKAEFAELLAEEPSGRPITTLDVELMRRSFMIRKRVTPAGMTANAAEEDGGPPVPPDVPMAQQTTNKFSSAFAKKAKQVAKHATKRPRPSSDDEGGWAGETIPSAAAAPPPGDFKSAVKPLVSKLVAMKWPGWSNPFVTVFKKSNAPPRYFEFIKRPMNLTFVRDNLNKNKYTSLAEVEADLELIVSNALTFNRPIDPVYQFALELQSAFRNELPLIKQTLEDLAQQEQVAGGSSGGGGDGQVDKKQRVR